MSFAPPESKSNNDGPSLLCSVNGCGNLWSVRLEGSPPKCSHHQWGAKPVNQSTSTYKQWADCQKLSKPVADWYKQPDQQKEEW